MADFTLADYRSTTLANLQEDRDNPENNQFARLIDVDKAINAARRTMLRKTGVGLFRTTKTVNATAGDISTPADFFGNAILTFAPDANTRYRLTPLTSKYVDETSPARKVQTGGNPTSFIWSVTPTGIVVNLYPIPTATVTNALIWSYTAILPDLVDDDDECPVMNLFPEFQPTTLQAGACRILSLLEGGEADAQYTKYNQIFTNEIKDITGSINGLFVPSPTNTGR